VNGKLANPDSCKSIIYDEKKSLFYKTGAGNWRDKNPNGKIFFLNLIFNENDFDYFY